MRKFYLFTVIILVVYSQCTITVDADGQIAGNVGNMFALEKYAPPPKYSSLWEESKKRPEWWDKVAASMSREFRYKSLAEQLKYLDDTYLAHQLEKHDPILIKKQGAKLLYDIVQECEDKNGDEYRKTELWAMYDIALIYELFLSDLPRAFRWYQRGNQVNLSDPREMRENRAFSAYGMIRCYEKIGYADMALDLYGHLQKMLNVQPSVYINSIRAESLLRMGDLYRKEKIFEEAKNCYFRCMRIVEAMPEDTDFWYKFPASRAKTSLKEMEFGPIDIAGIPDGRYKGSAYGYNSIIAVTTEMENGKIARIDVEYKDKRPLDAYRIIPKRIKAQQSLDVDAVTGATITSDGIVQAIKNAIFERGAR